MLNYLFNKFIFNNASAIWTVFSAAPFLKLSDTTHKDKPFFILLSFLIIVLNVLSIVATGYEGYMDDGVFGVLSSWQNIIRNIATIIGAVIAVVTIYEE